MLMHVAYERFRADRVIDYTLFSPLIVNKLGKGCFDHGVVVHGNVGQVAFVHEQVDDQLGERGNFENFLPFALALSASALVSREQRSLLFGDGRFALGHFYWRLDFFGFTHISWARSLVGNGRDASF